MQMTVTKRCNWYVVVSFLNDGFINKNMNFTLHYTENSGKERS